MVRVNGIDEGPIHIKDDGPDRVERSFLKDEHQSESYLGKFGVKASFDKFNPLGGLNATKLFPISQTDSRDVVRGGRMYGRGRS